MVKWVLLAGFVGNTGQELGLKYLENGAKPLLLLLPAGPTHEVLKIYKKNCMPMPLMMALFPTNSSLMFWIIKGWQKLLIQKN